MNPLTIRISFSILVNFFIIFIFTLINNNNNNNIMVNGEEYVESVNLLDEEYKAAGAGGTGGGGAESKKFNLGIELMAGTLAGVTSCILFYPLECIEAKLQVAGTAAAASSSIGSATTAAASNLFSNKKSGILVGNGSHGHGHGAVSTIGPMSMAKNILRTEGIKGFYQGLSPTVLGNAVNWGIYFSLYRATNHWWNNSTDQYGNTYQGPPWVGNSISAITAGIITTAVVNPFWVLKIRLATTKKYTGITHAFKSILRSEGIGGFWKGVGISFFGVSEGLFQFVSYEYILDQIKMASLMNGGDGTLTVGNYLFAGGSARLIAGCVTYPYLLIRSTLQSETCPYKSMSDTVKGIYRNDGIKGFYKGIGPNLARSVPPAAFMFYIVEFFRDILASKF